MDKSIGIYDYSKLKGYMKEKEITQEYLSYKTHISLGTINQNLKHGKAFRMENILKIANVLNIKPVDISYYFFKTKV